MILVIMLHGWGGVEGALAFMSTCTHTHLMLRSDIFSCTCTHTGWKICSLNCLSSNDPNSFYGISVYKDIRSSQLWVRVVMYMYIYIYMYIYVYIYMLYDHTWDRPCNCPIQDWTLFCSCLLDCLMIEIVQLDNAWKHLPGHI